MHILKVWLAAATKEERAELAQAASPTADETYLYFIANPEKSYGREPRPDKAATIEAAAKRIRDRSGEAKARLPVISRVDLNTTCRQCALARRCLGDAVIAAEFEYLGPAGDGSDVKN